MTHSRDCFVIRSEVKQALHLGHCSKLGNSAEGKSKSLEILAAEGWNLKDWGRREEIDGELG